MPTTVAAVNIIEPATLTPPTAAAPAVALNIENQTHPVQLSLPIIAVAPTISPSREVTTPLPITPTIATSAHQVSLQELLVHLSAAVELNAHKNYTLSVQTEQAYTITPTAPISQPVVIASTETAPPAAPPPPTAVAIEPISDGAVRTAHVPILMYHYLSIPPADANIYRQDLSVAPDLFAQHLDRMLAEGYTTISLYQLYDNLVTGAALPEKPVILTFDDGYLDVYENAFPLLRARNMTATLFVVTDFIDEQRPGYLTWDMAREMLAAGLSIESHGRNHISLKNKDADYLVWQALGSLETIQYELGVRPRFISYPAGEYDQQTIDLFKSANYWAGLTTIQGATHHSDDLFQIHRVRA
ncbi:MAG: polysaccharide deacetylase family protein [Caldilineaceae bacterium]